MSWISVILFFGAAQGVPKINSVPPPKIGEVYSWIVQISIMSTWNHDDFLGRPVFVFGYLNLSEVPSVVVESFAWSTGLRWILTWRQILRLFRNDYRKPSERTCLWKMTLKRPAPGGGRKSLQLNGWDTMTADTWSSADLGRLRHGEVLLSACFRCFGLILKIFVVGEVSWESVWRLRINSSWCENRRFQCEDPVAQVPETPFCSRWVCSMWTIEQTETVTCCLEKMQSPPKKNSISLS